MTERDIPADVGAVLKQSWEMFRKGWARYIATMLVIFIPAYVVTALLALGLGLRYWQGPGLGFMSLPTGGVVGVAGLVALVGMILSGLESGAVVSLFKMQWDGEPLSWQEAIRRAWPLVWNVVGASILVALLVLVGFILLIIPGIIVAFLLSLTVQAVVIDRLPITKALGTSLQAAAKAVVSVLVVVLIQAAAGAFIGFLFRDLGPAGDLLNAVGGLFVTTWAAIALGLCYLQGARPTPALGPVGASGPGGPGGTAQPIGPGDSGPQPPPNPGNTP
ncbi:MAG TPA: YciC family protein [Bacillota bacterium]|jgi:hypothetical protein